MATKFRKKPIVIEAIQFDGSDEASEAIRQWVEPAAAIVDTDHIEHLWDFDAGCYIFSTGKMIHAPFTVRHLIVLTLEGEMLAAPGWWIIKGVQGEFYPCDPDIFAKTYEVASAVRPRTFRQPPALDPLRTTMTQTPSIGRIVHYHSYGTPGGEFLPEPRAAVITCVYPDAPDLADPSKLHVGLAVLNPTGMFFNQLVPFAETPAPGHWSWPPRV